MILLFDSTFEGLLSAIFESYRLKVDVESIVGESDWQPGFFDEPLHITTSKEQATRVLKGLKRQCGKEVRPWLYKAFLTEELQVPMLIYDFVRKSMDSSISILDDYSDDTVRKLHELNKKMRREVHRMHAFVRFQRTRDDIYYAVIEPDFNVMPLLSSHFEKRYPSQNWLIYDSRRRYGIYYDQADTQYITFEDDHLLKYRQLNSQMVNEKEVDYQVFWKSYFDSVNIPERRNMKLHLKHVPRRYWKYLSEKRLGF